MGALWILGLLALAGPAQAALVTVVRESGKIRLSVDAVGTNAASGIVQAEKASGEATARKAVLACASFVVGGIRNGQVSVDGVPIDWNLTVVNRFFQSTFADVTTLLKPKLDAAPAGRINFTIAEVNTGIIDGCGLAVIFDDPTQTRDHTAILLFGGQSTAGETFTIGLADPIDKSDPDLVLDFGLGISFGFQPAPQFSIVDVNGQRLTSSAGGQDDGQPANGALITFGGLDDTNANPPPFAGATGPRFDDELYNLIPFVADGATQITIFTRNPSNHDNIFFASLFTLGRAVVGPIATNVRVIDTIPTTDLTIDLNSFSRPPFSVTTANGETKVEWRFSSFALGQTEDLGFDVVLRNPVAGEDRLVNRKLELLYTDATGKPVRTELGPQFVHVLASAFSTTVTTDKAQYGPNETVRINVSITNLSEFARAVDVVVEVEDRQGNLVKKLITLPAVGFAIGETKLFEILSFNTENIFAGDYRVRVRLVDAGEATTDFVVVPVRQAASTIAANKLVYSSNEAVTLTSTVTSQSPNLTLTGVEATVEVTDPQGAPIFTETRSLANLLPGARAEFRSFTSTGIRPAGLYRATLTVRSGGAPLTTAETSFEILPSAAQAAALAGSIQVNPASIFEKEQTVLTWTIQNIGNDIDLPLIAVEILVVDPDTAGPVRTITAEASLNGREVFTDSILFDSTGLAPKAYLVVLRATTASVTQTLDSAGLLVNRIPNTAPTADAGPDRLGFVGLPVTLDGSGSSDPDANPLTFTWRFVSVPAGSQLVDTSLADATTATPSLIPDTEGIYVLSLVVNDGLVDSQVDTVSVFVNPPPSVAIHPETINLKSQGGATSVTGVLKSPVLSSFEFFTAPDGVTVTGSFSLENRYLDRFGNLVVFTIPATSYPGDDQVVPVDADGDGSVDLYQLTLKFDRQLLIAGFTDAAGQLRITDPTALVSTVIGNGLVVGSDINTVISPPR